MKPIAFVLLGALAFAQAPAGAQQSSTGATAGPGAVNRTPALREGAKASPRQRAEFERAAAAERNAQAGAAFLAANKARPGVVTLPSGVQYRVLAAGSGARPTEASSVLCLYRGTLSDGTPFDRSDDRTPSVLALRGLVPGLREALKLMPVGSKWEIVVPAPLGYGARGAGGVGPNAVLVYTMELAGTRP